VELIAGFRYLHLAESLGIIDTFVPLVTAVSPAGVILALNNPLGGGAIAPTAVGGDLPGTTQDFDLFQTTNSFYGAQIGAKARWEYDWFSIGGFAKLGLGATRENVSINGATTLYTSVYSATVPGGLFALPSNIGNYHRTVFGYTPEVGVTLSAEITRWLRVTAAYSFLYWNAVARPGTVLDRAVSSSDIPSSLFSTTAGTPLFGAAQGLGRPAFRFADDSFYAQQFQCGVEFHY
jgi:hypothetical protein